MVGATKGDVFINGYNIKKKMGKIRSSLGLCPQHNLLSNDLTAMEHVMFFAMVNIRHIKFPYLRNVSIFSSKVCQNQRLKRTLQIYYDS